MTIRIDQPDTEADANLRTVLDEMPPHSFVMVAGAGSGKTTSLVKALAHLAYTRERQLRERGQRIACITYTDVAVGEISGDVRGSSLVHVSTIHSFLWLLISPFQSELRNWVDLRIREKIQKAEERLANPKTRVRESLENDIQRYNRQLGSLGGVERFSYGTGSNYEQGVLGHDDILKIGPYLIRERPLMRRLVAARFPIIFVDESQDTNQEFVDALKLIDESRQDNFCLGFFGDPMQKIYMGGAGEIDLGVDWRQIHKPENFRCPTNVLSLINRIRGPQDGLEQTRGRMELVSGSLEPVPGSVRLFILPADEERTARLAEIRRWLAQNNNDPLWLDDTPESDVRVLIIVHRMAANRLGFSGIYSALNDNAPDAFKKGLVDGTAWVLRPFLRYLLPLVMAIQDGRTFEVMKYLRQNCPRLANSNLAQADVPRILAELRNASSLLVDMLAQDHNATVGDVLAFVSDNQIATLDDRFSEVMGMDRITDGDAPADALEDPIFRFLQCPVSELWGYRTYLVGQSPFATQQGVKGAEFERVLVILDDEESDYNLFSYEKYFNLAPLSKTDLENQAKGLDSVMDRTSRLFYVCCSRARRDLAVTFFVADVNAAIAAVQASGIFLPTQIFTPSMQGGFVAAG